MGRIEREYALDGALRVTEVIVRQRLPCVGEKLVGIGQCVLSVQVKRYLRCSSHPSWGKRLNPDFA